MPTPVNGPTPIPLLHVQWGELGTLHERPNRFLGSAYLGGGTSSPPMPVHVHDPGRLHEILYRGNQVLLKHAAGPARVWADEVRVAE